MLAKRSNSVTNAIATRSTIVSRFVVSVAEVASETISTLFMDALKLLRVGSATSWAESKVAQNVTLCAALITLHLKRRCYFSSASARPA
jgi:hypothetical protein